jgi:hypothetical protein
MPTAPAKRILWPFAAALVLGAAVVWLAPRAFEAGWLLAAQDDPVTLADRAVDRRLTAPIAAQEIDAALVAGDVDLANSFVALSAERGIALSPELSDRVNAANATAAIAARNAKSFAYGLVTGEPDDVAGLAGTATGDLFVLGDLRDAAREGVRLAAGKPADELVLGLACVGIAVTAATYVSVGVGTPARVGLTLVKAARKTERLGAHMAEWGTRSMREVVDMGAVRRALAEASITQPALAVRAVRDAVKLDRAGELIDVARDVGRVEAKAGTRAALESLKVAQGPADMKRLARLAAAKGPKTRAIIKLAGRAAIVLTAAAVDLTSWLFSALLALFGFCSAVKGTTERATLRYVRWKKARRERMRWEALAAA